MPFTIFLSSSTVVFRFSASHLSFSARPVRSSRRHSFHLPAFAPLPYSGLAPATYPVNRVTLRPNTQVTRRVRSYEGERRGHREREKRREANENLIRRVVDAGGWLSDISYIMNHLYASAFHLWINCRRELALRLRLRRQSTTPLTLSACIHDCVGVKVYRRARLSSGN